VGVVARTYYSYSESDLIRSARHHSEIVDAIAARAPEWAESVMSAHVLAAATSAFPGRKDSAE
jgi:DNA-binding FadR family transcriptional regulator